MGAKPYEQSDFTGNTIDKPSVNRRTILKGLAAAVVAGGLAACGGEKNPETTSQEPQTTPQTESVPTTEPTAPEQVVDRPLNPTETKHFESLSPTNQQAITEYFNMSVETFDQLPYWEKQAYADFLFTAYEEVTVNHLKAKRIAYEPFEPDLPVTSTHEEVMDSFSIRYAIVAWMMARDDSGAIDPSMKNEAKKAVIGGYYTTDCDTGDKNHYLEGIDAANNVSDFGRFNAYSKFVIIMDKNTDTSGMDGDSTRDIAVAQAANGHESTYEVEWVEKFPTIDGRDVGRWLVKNIKSN